jgi:hypothetical protein
MTSKHHFGIAAVSAVVVAIITSLPLRAAPPEKDCKDGKGAVKVVNTPAEAIPIRNQYEPALQPVQRTELLLMAQGEQIKDVSLYTVPAGKRLVIEEASVRAQVFNNVNQAMVFLRSTGGGFAGHYVPLTSLGFLDGYGTTLIGTQLLRAYADAGTVVDASVSLNTAGGARLEITLTGHLIDL